MFMKYDVGEVGGSTCSGEGLSTGAGGGGTITVSVSCLTEGVLVKKSTTESFTEFKTFPINDSGSTGETIGVAVASVVVASVTAGGIAVLVAVIVSVDVASVVLALSDGDVVAVSSTDVELAFVEDAKARTLSRDDVALSAVDDATSIVPVPIASIDTSIPFVSARETRIFVG